MLSNKNLNRRVASAISKSKKESKVKITVVGQSGKEVTGSSYLVECPTGEKILLDSGMYQSHNKYESYKINNKKLKYDVKDLTFIAISHLNGDHLFLNPLLYKKGATCNTYMYYKNLEFVKPMLEDCVKIMEREAIGFTKKLGFEHQPIYTNCDVENALSHLRGVEANEIIEITENVSLQFIPAGHIYGSCQIVLYIKKPSGNIVKIGYTGDIGNIIFEQPFVEDFEKIVKCNFLIGEVTYSQIEKSAKKDQRPVDLEKLENVIRQTCIDNKGMVLIPCFALQRMETMLYTIWKIFKDDESFDIPIVVDSPLAVKIIDCFQQNLEGKDKELFEKILSWKNLKIIRTIEESKSCVEDNRPKCNLSSSGMLTQGRSILYLKKILPKSNSAIITCGFMAEGSLGDKIKNNPERKTITVDGKAYPNKCNIYSLKTFSSHMQYDELMNYYLNLANNGCETIWLVHGDEHKLEFKKELEKRITKIGKTTKVVATNLDTTARI